MNDMKNSCVNAVTHCTLVPEVVLVKQNVLQLSRPFAN